MGVGCLLTMLGLYAYARWIEPNRIVVETVEIAVPGLPAGLEDLTIAFVADLHLEAIGRREMELARIVTEIDPDLVLFGGDLVTVPYWMADYVRRAALACSLLGSLPSRHGVYAVWGNNDIPDVTRDLAERFGLQVLENEWVEIRVPGGSLVVVGIDDPVTGRVSFEDAFAVAPKAPFLVLCHSPDCFAEAARRGAPVVLAGHTHGGQLPFALPGRLGSRLLRLEPGTPAYRAGSYRRDGSLLYVTRGIGTSHAPLRFLCPPEVTRIRLRSADQRASVVGTDTE